MYCQFLEKKINLEDVNHYSLQNNGKIGITATKASHYVKKKLNYSKL